MLPEKCLYLGCLILGHGRTCSIMKNIYIMLALGIEKTVKQNF